MLRKTDPPSIAPYLRDASNFSGGHASEVLIPETLPELTEFLKTNSDPITVAGAGTGLTASRVPLEGKIVSLEKFKQLGEVEEGTIVVGPAVSLRDLREHLLQTGWFYPPNPTESLASLGGTLATNASGSRSYKFGVTRDYVLEALIVLADGRTVRLKRDRTIDEPLHCDDGSAVGTSSPGFDSFISPRVLAIKFGIVFSCYRLLPLFAVSRTIQVVHDRHEVSGYVAFG